MSGFKLLAIQPLKGCDKRFRKILKEGEIYQFYNDYTFDLDNNGDVKNITPPVTSLPPLYDQNKLKVNISAIVGKNGSGKSTLTELLYYSIYCLGTTLNEEAEKPSLILNPVNKKLENEKIWRERKLGRLEKRISETEIKLKSYQGSIKGNTEFVKLFPSFQADENEIFGLQQKLHDLEQRIPREKEEHEFIISHFKACVYYELGGVFFELRIDGSPKLTTCGAISGSKEELQRISEDLVLSSFIEGKESEPFRYSRAKDVLDLFFFTIAIDYSNYSLNSNHIGNWITGLFHKNDAYLAPVSINPMRTIGNIDFNKEHGFAMSRLLFNLIIQYRTNQNQVFLTEKQFVKKIRFTLNPSKFGLVELGFKSSELAGDNASKESFKGIWKTFFKSRELVDFLKQTFPFKEEIAKYIAKKWIQIRQTYINYSEKWDSDDLLDTLYNDDSHITFKLRQAIYFLQCGMEDDNYPSPWSQHSGLTENDLPFFDFSLKELNDWIPNDLKDTSEIMHYLPPSIFDVDIILEPLQEAENNESRFSDLSSGEQQLIHTIQSAIYHLNNIDSSHATKDERQTYRAVNIIYDEIELYFHPEYQRQFINRFLDSVGRIKLGNKEKGITSINLLFSTHSPFILSDIPSSNILRLGSDPKTKQAITVTSAEQTFGANIHQLLHNDFFLENGFMGQFSKHKINEVVDYLRNIKWSQNKKTIESELENDVDPETKQDLEVQLEIIRLEQSRIPSLNANLSGAHCKRIIDLVGEPILRQSLIDLYEEVITTQQEAL
jgi:hypothetical protein